MNTPNKIFFLLSKALSSRGAFNQRAMSAHANICVQKIIAITVISLSNGNPYFKKNGIACIVMNTTG